MTLLYLVTTLRRCLRCVLTATCSSSWNIWGGRTVSPSSAGVFVFINFLSSSCLGSAMLMRVWAMPFASSTKRMCVCLRFICKTMTSSVRAKHHTNMPFLTYTPIIICDVKPKVRYDLHMTFMRTYFNQTRICRNEHSNLGHFESIFSSTVYITFTELSALSGSAILSACKLTIYHISDHEVFEIITKPVGDETTDTEHESQLQYTFTGTLLWTQYRWK